MFRIALDNGHETIGYTAGKMRRYRIRIFPGDRIRVELRRTTSTAAASSTATAERPVAMTASRSASSPGSRRSTSRSWCRCG